MEASELTNRLREDILLLWQSDETRDRPPTVLDEVRTGLYFFEATLFNLLPEIYSEFARALALAYPGENFEVPTFLRYGSWIGGDRDGNPFVTVDVTEEALRTMKEAILTLYNVAVDELYHHLIPAVTRIPISPELADSIAEDFKLVPENEIEVLDRFRMEPYRQKLIMMFRRLRATRAENERPWDERVRNPRAYHSVDEFLHDLQLIDRSLRQNKGERIADGPPGRPDPQCRGLWLSPGHAGRAPALEPPSRRHGRDLQPLWHLQRLQRLGRTRQGARADQ